MQNIVAANWGDGAGITKEQAAKVTTLEDKFRGNSEITSFDEFEYFTGVTLLTHTYGFRNCTALRSIKLPEGLLELSGEVFQNCPIQEIEFPNSLEKVLPNNTFSGTQIKSFKVTGNIVMWNVNIYPSNLESVIFEENGNDIDVSLSFQNGRPINTLVLPKSCLLYTSDAADE